MTKLAQVGDRANSKGALAWPYDATQQNAYRLDGEDADIEQYHVTLEITGSDRDEVSATVFVYRNGKQTELDRTQTLLTLRNGDSIGLQGDLARLLSIVKQGTGCGTFNFVYGNRALDGHRVWAFSSEEEGTGEWAYGKYVKGARARYCQREDIKDASGGRTVIGTRLLCSFPGW